MQEERSVRVGLRRSLGCLALAACGAAWITPGCGDPTLGPADSGAVAAPTAVPDGAPNATPGDATVADASAPDASARDSGARDSGGLDSSVRDSGFPDVALPPSAQKLIFVHAANYLGPAFEGATGAGAALNGGLRLCFRAGPVGANSVLPVPPLPNKPGAGLPIAAQLPGTGTVLPARTDFSGMRMEFIAMNAQALAARGIANTTCGDLFARGYPDGGAALVDGVDYLSLGAFPAGTFAVETTYVLSAQGCAPGLVDPVAALAKCGAGYVAETGNLKLKLDVVSRAPVGAELGAQLIHATTGASAVVLNPGVVDMGGSFNPLAPGAATVYDDPISSQAILSGVNLASDTLTMNPALALPSYSFASAVSATSAGTPIALGTSHVFVVVGEANDVTGFATRTLHFLAFPANPVVPDLVP